MDKKNLLLKLAKLILSFGKVATDKAELIYDGELLAGTEVFVEVDGEMKPAEDGEYLYEDKKIIVKEGKVEEVLEVEDEPIGEPKEEMKEDEKPCNMEDEPKQEEPTDEPKEDEKDLRIAELEGLLADRDVVIEELNAKIKELEEKVAKPVEDPVKMNKVEPLVKPNGALKYFEK